MKGLELFDQAGVDLRPQIRADRDDKMRKYIEDEGIYSMTLQEYAEHKVCGKPYNELTQHEVREVGRFLKRGRFGYEFLAYDAPYDRWYTHWLPIPPAPEGEVK